jgi:hypothetical protein
MTSVEYQQAAVADGAVDPSFVSNGVGHAVAVEVASDDGSAGFPVFHASSPQGGEAAPAAVAVDYAAVSLPGTAEHAEQAQAVVYVAVASGEPSAGSAGGADGAVSVAEVAAVPAAVGAGVVLVGNGEVKAEVKVESKGESKGYEKKSGADAALPAGYIWKQGVRTNTSKEGREIIFEVILSRACSRDALILN